MHVVYAALEDARAIAAIHVDTWRAAYKSIVPDEYLASLSAAHRETMWGECIAKGSAELIVAKEAGAVRGLLCFGQCRNERSSEIEAEVWAMYVAPSAWSTGVGRLLWLRARELMLAQGFKSCSLWVFPQNDRAIKFYRSAGFVHDGSVPKSFVLGGTQLQEVRYVSRLDG